jgi:hypothetical protein
MVIRVGPAQCQTDLLHGSHESPRNEWLTARGFRDDPGANASARRPNVRVQPTGTFHKTKIRTVRREMPGLNDPKMRIAAIFIMVFNVGIVQGNDVDTARMIGTWSVSDVEPRESRNHGAPNVTAPMLISESQIAWDANNHRQCTAGYSVVSRATSSTFPGGPIANDNAADAYTIFQLRLNQRTCDQSIAFVTLSFAADVTDIGHFATLSADRTVLGHGAIFRLSDDQQTVGATEPLTPDEIAIYRDFLLHYPDQTSNMIGMQETTVAFYAPLAFGYESNPPDVITPTHHSRKLPPEVMALADEAAVTERIAAAGRLIDAKKLNAEQGPDGYVRTRLTLSEIAFDSKHETAVLVFAAHCNGKCGSRGTVVYKMEDGHWRRMKPILNFWVG